MPATPDHYLSQLQALLPPGAAWTREPDAVLTKVLAAAAEELARVDGRSVDLLEEFDPRTTFELLPDWERAAGLPDICTAPEDTLAGRRAQLHQKLTSLGGQSPAYFIAVAAALGFVITITEFRPFVAGSDAGAPVYDDDWAHAWQVNAPAETILYFTAGAGAGEPLASWGNAILECVVGRLKPAHTIVIFAYGGA